MIRELYKVKPDGRKMKKSVSVSLMAIFAAFNIVCDSLMGLPELSAGVWYSWIFLSEPITGILVGPYIGFLSSLIGVLIGHTVYFRGSHEFLFMLGAPLGAMIAGLLFRGKWKAVLIYYTLLLAAYFITPVAWQLPLWGMWDVYCAYMVLLIAVIGGTFRENLWKAEAKGLLYPLAVCSFIGLEADVLFRIFLFIPGQTYRLFYGFDVDALRLIWIAGAFETPVKVALSTIVVLIVGPPLVKTLKEAGVFPLSG